MLVSKNVLQKIAVSKGRGIIAIAIVSTTEKM